LQFLVDFRLRLVGVFIGWMENDGEKSEEKMVFVVIWLKVEKGRDFGGWGPQVFFLTPPKHNLSKLGENRREKWPKIFG